eukprot:353182-Chlamydomonas_euryale.AAC.3
MPAVYTSMWGKNSYVAYAARADYSPTTITKQAVRCTPNATTYWVRSAQPCIACRSKARLHAAVRTFHEKTRTVRFGLTAGQGLPELGPWARLARQG